MAIKTRQGINKNRKMVYMWYGNLTLNLSLEIITASKKKNIHSNLHATTLNG